MLDFFFQQAWRWKCDLPEESLPKCGHMPSLESLRQSEGNPKFIQFMSNRLVMGAFRYELWREKRTRPSDFIAGIDKKFSLYKQTGNAEHLVDIANYCQLEFTFPRHPNAHFKAEDDHAHCPVLE